jgi:predicted nucleic acid-binding protein
MKSVFADADYWIALLNPREILHERAKRVSARAAPTRIVTTEMVLAEVLNFLGSRSETIRGKACEAIRHLRDSPNVTIVPQTSAQFREAFSFYEGHRDKDWSLTDCASFIVMRETGIVDALTHDQHFQQAGFAPLLRESGIH